MTTTPPALTVSVVIPTFNRRNALQRVLEGLHAQDHVGSIETVVVSDGSSDGTDDYLASDRLPIPVVACCQTNGGPASARNRGVEAASGDLILFIDDDVVPTPGLVREHVSAHQRLGDRTVVIGPMLNPPDHEMTMWIRYEQAMLAKQYDAMRRGDWSATARQFYTGNASVRRKHLLAIGGFNTQLRRAEDVELALRLASMGLEFEFVPEAVGLHYAERSFESWKQIARAYGRSDVEFSRDPEHSGLLTSMMFEYRRRNVAIRSAVRVASGRPRVNRAADQILRTLATLGDSLGVEVAARLALSAIYNVSYYSGAIEALGGRREFARARRDVRPS